MNFQLVHSAVEIADTATGYFQNAATALKAIAGAEAFRKYNWLRGAPVTNMSGNFRGMVISQRWKSAFQVLGDIGDVAAKVAFLAGFAANVVQAAPRFESIYNSNLPWDIKAARLCTQTTSVAVRTLLGFVPGTTHLLSLSMEGYVGMADLATGGSSKQLHQFQQSLKTNDAVISSWFNKVTDGDNIYLYLNTQINR